MDRRRRAAPRQNAADALEALVRQFSQPLAFLRELVQNALDANTNRVEVEVRHEPAERCARVTVADTGEGMDRETIDHGLTRLFSSTKEGDLTKIGKFGVGFVSVFAVKPLAVVVDTGRGGESWRVIFNPDRSFDRNRLEEPCDGTTVTVYVPVGNPKAYAALERECRQTVSFWCKHCDVEVLFNGASLLEPFALEAPFQVAGEVPGTRVVVAPSPSRQPFYGFYNRGLTLLEGQGSPLPGVTFKCRSRYLEHTITRDNVLADENYHKALEVVARVAYHEAPLQLVTRLAQEPDNDHLWGLLAVVAGYPERPRQLQRIPFAPGLDRLYCLDDLRAPCSWSCGDEALDRAVVDLGVPVLARLPSSASQALRLLGVGPTPLGQTYGLAREVTVASELLDLLSTVEALLGRPVQPAALGGAARGRQAWLCSALGQARAEPGGGPVVAVEASHPWLEHLLGLARRDANLAAYLLASALVLELGLAVSPGQLLEAAMRRRSLA